MAAAAFAASVAVAAPAAAEEQVYYCTSELGTGIYKDEQTGQWRTGWFEDIRFTMKLGENIRSGDSPLHNRHLMLSLNGVQQDFICLSLSGFVDRCVRVLPSSIEGFFADNPNPNEIIGLWETFLITDLKRFELYLGSSSAFAEDGEDNSSMYAGTCETF